MALAASQDLPRLRDRLIHVIEFEQHRYVSCNRPRPPPIIDASDGAKDDGSKPDHLRIVGLKRFIADLGRELKRLEKFLSTPNFGSLAALSTNAPYLLAVWDEMVASRNVIAVCKNFPIVPKAKSSLSDGSRGEGGKTEVKVDVVSEDGKKWTRINTVTPDRFLRELYELEESCSDCDTDLPDEPLDFDGDRPSSHHSSLPAIKHSAGRDNSLFTMGNKLVHAAQNLTGSAGHSPDIEMRLTRLIPRTPFSVQNSALSGRSKNSDNDFSDDDDSEFEDDHRLYEQIERVRSLGIHISLGERDASRTDSLLSNSSASLSEPIFNPTTRLNLDLSILIALCSDITHSPPPSSEAEAFARFRKIATASPLSSKAQPLNDVVPVDSEDGSERGFEEMGEHLRSLSAQSVQEARRGLLYDIRARLYSSIDSSDSPLLGTSFETDEAQSSSAAPPNIELWATPSAKTRCLNIISKIGGPHEQARAQALFSIDRHSSFWRGSRYKEGYISGLPIRIFPSDTPLKSSAELDSSWSQFVDEDLARVRDAFWDKLQRTCILMLNPPHHPLLSQCMPPPSDATVSEPRSQGTAESNANTTSTTGHATAGNLKGAAMPMTAHTAQSLLWGSVCGMTTLTANKASVRTLLREMDKLPSPFALAREPEEDLRGGMGRQNSNAESASSSTKAAIWVVEPRSLAEVMKTDNAIR